MKSLPLLIGFLFGFLVASWEGLALAALTMTLVHYAFVWRRRWKQRDPYEDLRAPPGWKG